MLPTTICVEPPPTSHTATVSGSPEAASTAPTHASRASSSAESTRTSPAPAACSAATQLRSRWCSGGPARSRAPRPDRRPACARAAAAAGPSAAPPAASAARRRRSARSPRRGRAAPAPPGRRRARRRAVGRRRAAGACSHLRRRRRPARWGYSTTASAVPRTRSFNRCGRASSGGVPSRACSASAASAPSFTRSPFFGRTGVPAAVPAELPGVRRRVEEHVEDAARAPAGRARPRPARRARSGGRGCAASGRRCRGSRSPLAAAARRRTRGCARGSARARCGRGSSRSAPRRPGASEQMPRATMSIVGALACDAS